VTITSRNSINPFEGNLQVERETQQPQGYYMHNSSSSIDKATKAAFTSCRNQKAWILDPPTFL
jgi:hypothetical protein